MKLQPDTFDTQAIAGHGPGWISVASGGNTETLHTSTVIGSRGERLDWGGTRFADLTAEHFVQLAALHAEIVLFGSGNRLRFPPPAWLQPLMAQRTGLETMDTAAACRTYNVLATEGRHVLAVLLLDTKNSA